MTDQTIVRLKENILSAQVTAALQGHDLSSFEPINEPGLPKFEAYRQPSATIAADPSTPAMLRYTSSSKTNAQARRPTMFEPQKLLKDLVVRQTEFAG